MELLDFRLNNNENLLQLDLVFSGVVEWQLEDFFDVELVICGHRPGSTGYEDCW